VPTKAGTAYVDIVGNFAPLNRQIARMGGVSAQAGKSFSRSMKVVSREAEDSRRKVARLSRQISGIGEAAQTSSRQTTRALRQVEASSGRALRSLRQVEAAQSRVAAGARIGGGRASVRGGGTQAAASSTVVQQMPRIVSEAAVQAAIATAARQAASQVGTIGAAPGAYSTYGLARSFGRGRAASTVAEVGARASSALSIGKTFAKTFAKGLGPGLATAGVENILSSALKGDMKSAGFKAGGALVGGVLGSFAGPAGTMIGVGLGSMAGEALSGLFGSSKKTLTLQQRLAASAKQVTFAYRGLKASTQTLARSGEIVVRAHAKARKASREVVAAERQLARARRQFGPNSKQVANAEQRLTNHRHRSAKASKAAQRAERLHGMERKVQQEILRATILEERHQLILLQKNEKQLHKELATAYKNERSHEVLIHLKGKLAKNQAELTETQKKQNDTLRESTQTIGPKYTKYLRNASGEILRAGRNARTAQKDLEKPARAFKKTGEAGENSARRAKRGYDRLGAGLGAFTGATIKNMGKASGAMKDFDAKTNRAMGNVRTGANQTLVGFGVAKIDFGVARKQVGGAIVPGSGEGDSFRTSLPVGSFVLNKKATQALGFRKGGQVPVMLEPGERTFLPHEVKRIGRSALEAANAAIPRFATGGSLTEPQLQGPEPLRRGGQGAIRATFKAAQRYIEKHRPTGGIGATGPVPKDFKELLGKWKPNHPRWDVWQVGLLLQKMGYAVGENPHFGGVQPVHTDGSYHYSGRALDVNADGAPGGEAAALDKLYAVLSRIPHSELLWRVADHYDHLHYAYRRGGPVQRLQRGGLAGDAGHAPGTPVARRVRLTEALRQKLATGGNVARMVAPILLRNGLDPESAAGILGNAWQESTWNPGAMEGESHNGGLWGFTTPPKDLQSAKDYAASQGVPWTNAKAQTQFMLHLLPQSMRRAMNRMSSIEDTTKYFMEEWEIPDPAQANFPRRLEGARMALPIVGGAKAGAESAAGGGEKIPPTYRTCQTGPLTFPAIPKEGPDISREIAHRQKELEKYRKTAKYAREKDNRPGVAAALEKNVEALRDRLTKLREARHKIRFERAKKRLSKGIRNKLGKIAGYEKRIEGQGRAFDIGMQEAEQLVALEPQPPVPAPGTDDKQVKKDEDDYVKAFTSYVDVTERNAYTGLLGRASEWRNEILRAETFGFGDNEPSVERMQNRWEVNVVKAASEIKQINQLTANVEKHVEKWRRENPKKAFPKWLKEQIRERDRERLQLPLWRLKEDEFRKAVGEARGHFFPGGNRPNGEERVKPPPTPLPGSGSLEDTLNEVQGVHWPDPWHHQLLTAADLAQPPTAGRFGGVIWDLQMTIKDLGLKISDVAGSGSSEGPSDESDSERTEILEELARQEGQRASVAEAQFAALRDFSATYPAGVFPPYAGKAHSGAVVPGPPTQEKTMILRGQERIRTPEQELALAESARRAGSGGDAVPQLIVNGSIVQEAGDTRDPVEAVINDRRFPVAVRQVAMGGRVTPGGARS
jgi:Phage tail lysozyme